MSDQSPYKHQSNHPLPPEETSVLERVLEGQALGTSGMSHQLLASWEGSFGTLEDGRQVRLSPSCLLQPSSGDQVLVWTSETGSVTLLLVLVRNDEGADFELTSTTPITIEAPVLSLKAGSLRFKADDFYTYAKRRFAFEHTRTESMKMRIAQLDLDIRRAGTVFDHIEGSFMQRAGTWISNTVRDVRHKARTFLFD